MPLNGQVDEREMPGLSRREFLYLGSAAIAGLSLTGAWSQLTAEAASIADLTTLGRTIVRGSRKGAGSSGIYYALAAGAGEPHLLRTELAAPRP
ncbi:MAG: hypothetical protein ACYDGR_17775, partial [Candidatus Dormibacteria bacterium]